MGIECIEIFFMIIKCYSLDIKYKILIYMYMLMKIFFYSCLSIYIYVYFGQIVINFYLFVNEVSVVINKILIGCYMQRVYRYSIL